MLIDFVGHKSCSILIKNSSIQFSSIVFVFAYWFVLTGMDVIGVADTKLPISSLIIVAIAVAGVFLLLIIIDFICCAALNLGILAMFCRSPKRSPSDLDEEKFGR